MRRADDECWTMRLYDVFMHDVFMHDVFMNDVFIHDVLIRDVLSKTWGEVMPGNFVVLALSGRADDV